MAIDVSRTRIAGAFQAGQSFGVLPPGLDDRGLPHKLRLYSIASPSWGEDGKGQILSTTVKRVIDEHNESHRLFLGVASNYLCDLKVGDELKVTGPNGKRFLIPARAGDHDYAFFATGTGIAPFRGMIMELLQRPDAAGSRIVLVMGSPYGTDLLYDRQFRDLAQAHPNFTYLTAVSRDRQEDGSPGLYVDGRLRSHRDLFGSVLDSERGLVYVCGIAGMEMGIFRGLERLLPGSRLDPYVQIDSETRAEPGSWERRMLHKQIKPTRRVFLEVY